MGIVRKWSDYNTWGKRLLVRWCTARNIDIEQPIKDILNHVKDEHGIGLLSHKTILRIVQLGGGGLHKKRFTDRQSAYSALFKFAAIMGANESEIDEIKGLLTIIDKQNQ